jgi:hypothetical protein
MVLVRYYRASFKSALMVNGSKQLLSARKYVRQIRWFLGPATFMVGRVAAALLFTYEASGNDLAMLTVPPQLEME